MRQYDVYNNVRTQKNCEANDMEMYISTWYTTNWKEMNVQEFDIKRRQIILFDVFDSIYTYIPLFTDNDY